MSTRSRADKVFETIQLLLMAALVFGGPIAAVTPYGKKIGWWQSLKQVAAYTLLILALMAVNFVAGFIHYKYFESKNGGSPGDEGRT